MVLVPKGDPVPPYILIADDIDTLCADVSGPIFFSLDSGFADALEAFPANSGTAFANGLSGADVLVSVAGGAPTLAVPASALGLDVFGFGHGWCC